MTKYLEYLGLGMSGLVVASVGYFAWRIYDPEARACGNQMLGTYPSPGGSKKAVLFGRDCGATTAFFVEASIMAPAEASIMAPAEELQDTDKGNIFAADSDHGAAAQYNPIGGPAVGRPSVRTTAPSMG